MQKNQLKSTSTKSTATNEQLMLQMLQDFLEYNDPAEVMATFESSFAEFIVSDSFQMYFPRVKQNFVSLHGELVKLFTGLHYLENPTETPTQYLERTANVATASK